MKKQIRAMAAALSFGILVSSIPNVEALAAALAEKKEKGSLTIESVGEAFGRAFQDYTQMLEDTLYTAEITEDRSQQVYQFVPEETADYTFFSYGAYDTEGAVYRADGSEIASNDDGSYGVDFAVECTLYAGETYYCVAQMLNESGTGQFLCMISSVRDHYVPSAEDMEAFEVLEVEEVSCYPNSMQIPLANTYQLTLRGGVVLTDTGSWNGKAFGSRVEARFKYVMPDNPFQADVTREDNAVIYSFMGVDAQELPVTFIDSPIVSMECTQNPWESLLQETAESQVRDLYGLDVALTYTDGSVKQAYGDEEYLYVIEEDEWYDVKYRWKTYDENGLPEMGNNALLLSVMGAMLEVPITIIENPVESISILQNPFKTSYLPFERIDLYGMRLLISYKDGTSKEEAILEHGNTIWIDDYGQYLESSFDYDEYDRIVMEVYYMDAYAVCSVNRLAYTSIFGTAAPIAAGQTASVSLSPDRTYQLFQFVPGETAEYVIRSAGECDTYVRLIDQNGEIITEEDDSDEDENFILRYRLEAGKTYYYLVSMYNSNTSGTFSCTLTGGTMPINTPVSYSITYVLNGGTNHAANPAVCSGAAIALQNPSRAGYLFGGWYTDSACTAQITQIPAGAGQNYTLYAKWTKVAAPGKAKLSSVKNAKAKKATVKYKKVKDAEGYEIAYSTNRKFRQSATKTAVSAKTGATIGGLKKGKTYFVRVCAYKLDSTGTKVRGKWSNVKKIKMKK